MQLRKNRLTSSSSCERKNVKALSYKSGTFVLAGAHPDKADAEKWEKSGNLYATTDFKAAARFRRWADDRAEKIFDRAFVKSYQAPSRPLPLFLDPHQREGVEWVLTRSRSYLAHAPGAGKTCQAVVAALYCGGQGQAVFIVPPSLTTNWEREIRLWHSKLDEGGKAWPSIAIIPESINQVFTGWAAEFLIVPDSMLTRPWVLDKLTKIKKRFVAVDEASRFKDSGAQRTRALFGGTMQGWVTSPGLVYDCKHSVLLDGSPMPNRPMELWAPTFAMSPESIDFMSQQDFGFRYCGAKMNERGNWEFKHSAHEAELQARLQHSFMHVVTEDKLEHPERKRSMLFMTDDARSPEQRTWERRHLHAINFSDIDEDLSRGELAHFRRELGIRKAPWVANYIKDRLVNKDESLLLFAWHRDVIDVLAKRLARFSPGVVMGGTKDAERELYFDEFQRGKRKLIIGNIGAMGRGHNLQRADRVVFAEFSWNDELNKQCEHRAARKGRAKELDVRCDYVVAPNSMDEPILSGVFRKAERVRRIIG